MPAPDDLKVSLHTYFITQSNPFLADGKRKAAKAGGHIKSYEGPWENVLQVYYNESRPPKVKGGDRVWTPRRLPECLDKVKEVGRQPTIDDRKMSLPLCFLGDLRGVDGKRRTKKNVAGLWAIGVDLDGKIGSSPDFEAVLEFTKNLGYRAEVHTTAKHRPEAPRVRVLFLFDELLPNEYGRVVWEHLVQQYDTQGWERDPSTKDVSRGWYAAAGGAEDYHQGSVPGAYFDWHPLVEEAEVNEILRGNTKKGKTARARLRASSEIYLEDGDVVGPDELLDTIEEGGKVKCFCPSLSPEEHNSVGAFATVMMKDGRPTLYVHCGAVGHSKHEGARLVATYTVGGTTPMWAAPEAKPIPDSIVDMLVKQTDKKTGQVTIKNTIANLAVIMEHDEELAGKLKYDTFSLRGYFDGGQISNTTPTEIQRHISATYGCDWTYDSITKAIAHSAEQHPFDQRLDWLESLPQWTRSTEEAEMLTGELASHGFGVDDTKLYRVYTMRFMIGLIARAMQPGCKHDTMIILTGLQGAKKSTALSSLMHDENWFSDTPLNIRDTKACVERMMGVWLQEWGELSAMTSASFGEVKQFTASSKDQLRMAYGRFSETVLRQGCRAGTSNIDAVLHDVTGSRREWPMKTYESNPAWIIMNRDSLFSAAIHLYRAGKPWWLTDEEDALRITDSTNFRIASELEAALRNYTEKRHGSTLDQIVTAVGLGMDRKPKAFRKKVAMVLGAMGWTTRRVKLWNGSQQRAWCRPNVNLKRVKELGAKWNHPDVELSA